MVGGWRVGISTFWSFSVTFRVLASRNSAELTRITLATPNDSSATAGSAALGNGWLVGLGILVADRISCVSEPIGLADGLQPSTERRLGHKRLA